MEKTNETSVKIVIPIYKNQLDEYESKSLNQCVRVLSAYPIVFAKPQSLDIKNLKNDYQSIESEEFADEYFASIIDYNRLLLSPEFYERFSNNRYILVYQLDAYVFKDELREWCMKNYDYIGAPWLLKSKYNYFPFWLFLKIKAFFYLLQNRPYAKTMLGNKIGNGGLSLRKVSSHLDVCKSKKSVIDYFIEKSKHHTEFNEDVFWATENPEFLYPKVSEALLFSIDENPHRCLLRIKGKLPFGCHGWSKSSKFNFWKDKINGEIHENT